MNNLPPIICLYDFMVALLVMTVKVSVRQQVPLLLVFYVNLSDEDIL